MVTAPGPAGVVCSTTSTNTLSGHVEWTVPSDGQYELRARGRRQAGGGTVTANSLRVSTDDVGVPVPL